MKIANIIYEKELVNHTEVEYINYYKGPQEYDKLDKTLPTLYVGWSFMKFCNPGNQIIQHADILKKKIISNELYWECSFEESKQSHVRGVENFVNAVPQFYFGPKYGYVNLDPVFFQIVDIEGLMDVLPKEIQTSYCFKDEMLYVLGLNNLSRMCIWGINLKMYEFFKFNLVEIKEQISIRSAVYMNDMDGQMYLNQYKILPNFNLLKRYLITILSK
jgi:hypothetical protein